MGLVRAAPGVRADERKPRLRGEGASRGIQEAPPEVVAESLIRGLDLGDQRRKERIHLPDGLARRAIKSQ
jgi:hypothetical protein